MKRGIIILIRHYDTKIERNPSLADDPPYEEIFNLFCKIIKANELSNPIVFLMDAGRLKWSKVFHSICGIALGREAQLSAKYIEGLDFGLESNRYGEAFYKYFKNSSQNDEDAKNITTMIANRYFEYLKEKGNVNQINHYTSYYNCIFDFFLYKITDQSFYLNEIEKHLNDIFDLLHSWNFNELNVLYSKLYLLIVSNLFLNFHILELSNSEIFNFLNDNRFKPILKEANMEFLKKCLLSPATVDEIILSGDNNAEIKLSINRNNEI